MNRSIASKITHIGKRFVRIEITETRPGFEPLRTTFEIKHDGNPEEVHRGFHDLISKTPEPQDYVKPPP
jgi:hypothetical protein